MLGVLPQTPIPPPSPEAGDPRACLTCGKTLLRGTGERMSTFELRRTCSHVCRLRWLLTDGVWQRTFPGAQHRDWSTVPVACDRTSDGSSTCAGRLQVTETGVRCLQCGGDQVIAQVLVERLVVSSKRIGTARRSI